MRQSGFTLIEVIVSVAIFSVIGVGVIVLVGNLIAGSNQQAVLLADTDQARRLGMQITGELRNATTASTGAFAVDTAAAQQLIFYANVDADAAIERVRYYLQNGKLYRGIIDHTGSPLTYNAGNEVSTAVQSDVANGSNPIFYYYDDAYNGTASNFLAQPVNVTVVKFVQLNLQIYNKAGQQKTNTYTVTAGATVRNLKTNLGN